MEGVLDRIVAILRESRAAVVKAPPGAGKTTLVPPALLNAGLWNQGRILLVQPRRLAARSAAARLARLLHCKVGETAGYQVRFDRKATSATRLIAVTPGVLLRRLQADPLLEDVGAIVLDEFHERSLELDLALGMVERIRTSLRPELGLVVMSATLDPEPIVSFLSEAEGVVSEGRQFNVDLRYSQVLSRQPVEEKVVGALPEALRETNGHLLVFLPGTGEIRRVRSAIEHAGMHREIELFELHGSLSPALQDAAVAPSASRKLVLTTNVAETSITIPGVTGVIDSGLARVMRFDTRIGLPRLQLETISQASADQRAGRAGRTEPGVCWRLWPKAADRARPLRDAPEIERSDFSSAALMLYSWGERDLSGFPWLTSPPQASVDHAQQLLLRMGAIDLNGRLTEVGKQMARLPIHPRLAKFLLTATSFGIIRRATLAASLLTEKDPLRSTDTSRRPSSSRRPGFHASPSSANNPCDLSDRVERVERAMQHDASASQRPAFKHLQKISGQLTKELRAVSATSISEQHAPGDVLQRALLAAYPDRVAKRRTTDSNCGLMVGGRGVRLHPRSSVRYSELFLCVDVDSGGDSAEAIVRSATALERDWLDPQRIRTVDEAEFQASREAVVMRRRIYYEDLLLDETPIACSPNANTAALLFERAKQRWDDVFPTEPGDAMDFVTRVRFLNASAPDLGLPPLDQNMLEVILKAICESSLSFDEVRSAPWSEFLQSQFTYEQLRLVDSEAPPRLRLPSGNFARIVYSDDNSPFMKVRLQELFGWEETPRIARRRVPIQLHLLGPNFRPQQITDDLANFWEVTYHEVRKELRRRYPKHHWPEDPRTAHATKNALKPKKKT